MPRMLAVRLLFQSVAQLPKTSPGRISSLDQTILPPLGIDSLLKAQRSWVCHLRDLHDITGIVEIRLAERSHFELRKALQLHYILDAFCTAIPLIRNA